jgi:hypothetical protein
VAAAQSQAEPPADRVGGRCYFSILRVGRPAGYVLHDGNQGQPEDDENLLFFQATIRASFLLELRSGSPASRPSRWTIGSCPNKDRIGKQIRSR